MDINREVIAVHIGQAGIQMGQAIWEMFAAEHGIHKDGIMTYNYEHQGGVSTYFKESVQRNFVPRALFLDLEASVVDEIKNSTYRDLYHPDCFVNALDDSACNFSRAYYTTGTCIYENYVHHLRRMVEECDHLQAFMVIHSQGGGTGSGICSKVMEYLSSTYGKTAKIEFPIFPSPVLSNAIVEPYNTILCNHFCIEHSDLCMMLDNEAMYEICMRYLNLEYPTFHHINRMIAHLTSTLTCNLRFDGGLRADLSQLATNLVPYPRIHFILNSFAPFLSADRRNHEILSTSEITRMAFNPRSQMAKLETELGKYMSIALFYRGDTTPREVKDAILSIKKEYKPTFVDWCPTGFKVSINDQGSTCIPAGHICNSPRYVSMMSNNTAAAYIFQKIAHKFKKLFLKRAFVHWFVGEGLEEGEFSEGLENMNALSTDYIECGYNSNEAENADEDVDHIGIDHIDNNMMQGNLSLESVHNTHTMDSNASAREQDNQSNQSIHSESKTIEEEEEYHRIEDIM